MNKLIRAVAVMGLIAVGLSAGAAHAAGPCDTGPGLYWGGDAYAYETNYAPYVSQPGSQLTVLGIIAGMCEPLLSAVPYDPAKEYTFVLDNLTTAAGTQTTIFAGFTFYDTYYGSGTFAIYEDASNDAKTAVAPPGSGNWPLPDAAFKGKFTNGTLLLAGTLADVSTSVSGPTGSVPNGSIVGHYTYTGGSLFPGMVSTPSNNLLQGNWNPNPASLPNGYSAQSTGKFDTDSPTPTRPSTWGTIKSMYR
jgi:hypothetical protein